MRKRCRQCGTMRPTEKTFRRKIPLIVPPAPPQVVTTNETPEHKKEIKEYLEAHVELPISWGNDLPIFRRYLSGGPLLPGMGGISEAPEAPDADEEDAPQAPSFMPRVPRGTILANRSHFYFNKDGAEKRKGARPLKKVDLEYYGAVIPRTPEELIEAAEDEFLKSPVTASPQGGTDRPLGVLRESISSEAVARSMEIGKALIRLGIPPQTCAQFLKDAEKAVRDYRGRLPIAKTKKPGDERGRPADSLWHGFMGDLYEAFMTARGDNLALRGFEKIANLVLAVTGIPRRLTKHDNAARQSRIRPFTAYAELDANDDAFDLLFRHGAAMNQDQQTTAIGLLLLARWDASARLDGSAAA